MTTDPVPLSAAAIYAEHRECGTPNGYDGCYSHVPMPHCRADGMALPCDVLRLATLDEARATPSGDLDMLALAIHKTRHGNDDPDYDMAEARRRAEAVLAALRSVSADSTAGLDVERLTRAVASAVYESNPNDDDRRMAEAIAREYAALSDTSGDTA